MFLTFLVLKTPIFRRSGCALYFFWKRNAIYLCVPRSLEPQICSKLNLSKLIGRIIFVLFKFLHLLCDIVQKKYTKIFLQKLLDPVLEFKFFH